jgi:oligopeptide/dipeptide ABC transporter ATP-binding protein
MSSGVITKNNTIEVRGLSVHFDVSRKGSVLKAVDDVSFVIGEKEVLSLVGESGSGKTTTGKAILGLVPIASGEVYFRGEQVDVNDKEAMHAFRRQAQMIYQDPYQSLNPRDVISDIVAEPLVVNKLAGTAEERDERVRKALSDAGLSPAEEYLYRYPYELSGGQRQRVAIASSMILRPSFVVADEPVSMLDASVRTGILKLMMRLRDENELSYLFITHDLSLAWLISDRIAIMYLGKIMEIGPADTIIRNGLHPYTKALTEIMPTPGQKRASDKKILQGETPDASSDIVGCKFRGRCPIAEARCAEESPELKEYAPGHSAACLLL